MPAEVNDLLKDKLTESITEVQGWLNGTKDFVLEQAPLVIQEVLRWEIYSSLFFIGLGILLSIIYSVISYIFYNLSKTVKGGDSPEVCYALSYIVHLLHIITIIMVCTNLYHMVYVWCAPRVFLIEKVAELIK
jgi:hypothetical protein